MKFPIIFNNDQIEFLRYINHDIRSHISGITGIIKLILDMENPPKIKKYLNLIESSGKDQLKILDDLSDFFKVESNRIEFSYDNIDLLDIIEEVKNMISKSEYDKVIKLSVDIHKDIFTKIITDPSRLKQIILNLVTNIIKFTNNDRVFINISPVKETNYDTTISFTIKDDDEYSQFQEDNLSQLLSGLIPKYAVASLEIFISKKLVELMGGEIYCAIKKDKTFMFQFVIKFQKTEQTHLMKILVAEEMTFDQLIIASCLNDDYKVTLVNRGNEVLDVLDKETFDLILMNIKMPEIQQILINYNIPIIAIVDDNDDKSGFRAGIKGYIKKPVIKQELDNEIKKVFSYNEDCCYNVVVDESISDEAMIEFNEKMPIQLNNVRKALDICDFAAIENCADILKKLACIVKEDYIEEKSFSLKLAAKKFDIKKCKTLYEQIEKEYNND